MRSRNGSSKIFVAAAEDRRSKTHAKLMDAAVTLFAERGIVATSILEITARAKVANGTFYNYFNGKEALINSVYEHSSEYLGNSLINNLDRIPDSRHQIALGTIWFVRAMTNDRNWGRIMMHGLQEPGLFHAHTVENISRFINNGIQAGQFKVSITRPFMDLYISVLAGAIRSSLDYVDIDQDVGILAAEIHLRMLGLTPKKAADTPNEALLAYGEKPSQCNITQQLYRSPSAE